MVTELGTSIGCTQLSVSKTKNDTLFNMRYASWARTALAIYEMTMEALRLCNCKCTVASECTQKI